MSPSKDTAQAGALGPTGLERREREFPCADARRSLALPPLCTDCVHRIWRPFLKVRRPCRLNRELSLPAARALCGGEAFRPVGRS